MKFALTLLLFMQVMSAVVAADSKTLRNRLEREQKIKPWFEIVVAFQFDIDIFLF